MKLSLSFAACQLLMEILEQSNPIISHRTLMGPYANVATSLNGHWLENGPPLSSYTSPDSDICRPAIWRDDLQSHAYMTDYGSWHAIPPELLRTYTVSVDNLITWFRQQLDILDSGIARKFCNDHLLYFGDCFMDRRKVSVYLARRITDQEQLETYEAFFHTPLTKHTRLILTSSHGIVPPMMRNRSPIVSVHQLIEHSTQENKLNCNYLASCVFGNRQDIPKPYVHSNDDGSMLNIGDQNWLIPGDKCRQIIPAMVELWQNSQPKNRWETVKEKAGLGDDPKISRPKNFFNEEFKANLIDYDKGMIWFRTD